MKAISYLTGISFIAICVSGILFWQALFPLFSEDSLLSTVGQIKRAFKEQTKPIALLNLELILQQQSLISSELIDPTLTLPQTSNYPYSEIQPLQYYEERCGPIPPMNPHNPALEKAFLWAKFHCGVITTLPSSFFTSKPLMHPSGKSYAFLAYQAGYPLNEVQGAFHLAELLGMKAFQTPLLDLTPWQLQLLIKGENQIVNNEFVFFPSSVGLTHQNRVYSLYTTKSWMHFLAGQKYTVLFGARSQHCLYKEGNACWVENPNYKAFNFRLITLLFFAAFLIWVGLLLIMRMRRARLQKLEAAQRLFTLQMLTHELRTPTASMRISLEGLRKHYDELPGESQKAFLQICEELQRLNRVVDASKTYLSTDETRSEVCLNELVTSIVQTYEKEITFTPLFSEVKMILNAYWLELCIRNLIDNAFHHGCGPVKVTLSPDNSGIAIEVQDQGQSIMGTLHDMTNPFYKAKTSQGLGLGLTITEKMIQSMNGTLSFQQSPTRFTIHLRFK